MLIYYLGMILQMKGLANALLLVTKETLMLICGDRFAEQTIDECACSCDRCKLKESVKGKMVYACSLHQCIVHWVRVCWVT